MIPSFLLFSPFQKGYVQAHTRMGKQVGPYFTKRPPGKVQEKHTRERFIDHDKESAAKAHAELESLKSKHQELLNAAQKHHDELKSKGSSEGAVDHKTKLSHLKAEIKNQKTNIDNHSRKQKLIKDRYKISSKQIVQRKEKSDLERKIASHSDEQKKTIRAIHEAHKKGESKLEPGRILKGKDKYHVYLETKHSDTGETHHIAIHKDGSVKDPQILHGGKFDSKTLKEDAKPKKIVVKAEPKKEVTVKKQETFKKVDKPETKETKKIVVKKDKFSSPPTSVQTTFKRKSTIDEFTQQTKDQGLKVEEGFTFRLGDVKNRIYRVEGKDKSGNLQAYSYVKGVKQPSPITIFKEDKNGDKPKKIVVEKSDQEKKETRSQAMKGNKNAFKGGPKDEPKQESSKQLDQLNGKGKTGRTATIITARSKDKHKVQYKVIEANDKKLVASNHPDGRINKDYPTLKVKGALQMRDRTNIQSQAQITQMSNDIEPMFLTDSNIASDGAPIVGSDYAGKEGHSIVESGNGRIMALRTAYENGKADHYKKHLVEEAESFGIDPETISSMKNPILVRERVNKLDDQQKAKFAKEANKSSVSQMTAIEQAVEDSNYLGGVSYLNPTEGGRITNNNNSDFIKEFFTQVLDNDSREVGKLLNSKGQLNDEGERRITNAVFVSVYGANSDVMNKLIMKDSDQTKKITAGMLAAAPRMAKFKKVMTDNDRHDMDIASNFIDALTAMEDLKRDGVPLEQKLRTIGWEEFGIKDDFKDPFKNEEVVGLLKMIQEFGSGSSGSSAKIASLLTNYADEAEKIIRAENPDMLQTISFDSFAGKEEEKTSKTKILGQVKDDISYKSADKKGTQKSYEKYLKDYPNGKFANDARFRLNQMRHKEAV